MSDSTVTIAGIDLSLMIKIFLELKKKVSPRMIELSITNDRLIR